MYTIYARIFGFFEILVMGDRPDCPWSGLSLLKTYNPYTYTKHINKMH